MKKGLVLAVAMLLLSSMVFAGSFYIEANPKFSIPVAGWESKDFNQGFDKVDVSNVYLPGTAIDLGVGYYFSDAFSLGLLGGFGFNPVATLDKSIYTIPFSVDMGIRLFRIGDVNFITELSAGGFARMIDGKIRKIGPSASLALGVDVKFNEHFMFGVSAGVSLLAEFSNKFTAVNLQLDCIPVAMSARYLF